VIFVDTGFLFALASEKDLDHERVRQVFEEFDPAQLSELLITTNHVFSESITLTRASLHHRAAVEMGERLYDESLARIHWATPADEYEAFEYLKKYKDKEYSAVDCLSFVIMERFGIREALAIDRDFTHRFTARPGPRD
jgi:predicted nucleic acid-binding protein